MVYLDENGNPIKTYLDDSGNPVSAQPKPQPSVAEQAKQRLTGIEAGRDIPEDALRPGKKAAWYDPRPFVAETAARGIGFAEGIAGLGTLAADVAGHGTNPTLAVAELAKRLATGRDALPATAAMTRVGDKASNWVAETVAPGLDVETNMAVNRLVGDLMAPGPEVMQGRKLLQRGAKPVATAVDEVAPVVDNVVPMPKRVADEAAEELPVAVGDTPAAPMVERRAPERVIDIEAAKARREAEKKYTSLAPEELIALPEEERLSAFRVLQERSKRLGVDKITGLETSDEFLDALESGELAGHRFIQTDADNLKTFNDKVGHQAGNAFLATVAKLGRETLDEMGVATRAFRTGGDEFTFAVKDLADEQFDAFLGTVRKKLDDSDVVFVEDGVERIVGREHFRSVSAGIGDTYEAADAAARADKGTKLARLAEYEDKYGRTSGLGRPSELVPESAGGGGNQGNGTLRTASPEEVGPPGTSADAAPTRTGLASQFLEPITRRLERSGPVGQKVNKVLTFIDRAWKQNASRPISALPKLKDLSESDMQDWIAVMTGADPMRQVSPDVSALAREFRMYFDDVAARSRAAKVGVLDDGKYREFLPRENYLPQIFERDKAGHFKVREDFYGTFTGNIQRARKGEGKTLDPSEVVEVLRTYFARSNKTIAEARFLGDGQSVYTPQAMKDRVVEWANEADAAGEDGEYLSHYLPRVFGAEKEVTAAERRFIDFAGAFETVAKLPLAVFSNANQTAATFARAGMRPAAFALKELLTSAGRGRMMDAYVKSGAGLDYMTRELMNPSGTKISAFAQGVLKYTGFSLVEKWNRVIAVNAGAGYANDLARIVRGEKGTLTQMGKEFARQDLARILAVDLNQVEEIAKRGLTQDELADAGLWMSEKTQFSTNRESLPPKWIGTPWANVLTNLKSFALKQAHFIKDELVTPAFKGRPGPLMRYLATGVPAAAVTGYVKDLVTGKDRSDDETIDVVVDRVAMILMMDQVSRMFSDVRRGQGLKAVSPTIAGDITNAGVAAYQTGMDVKDLATGDKDGEDILDDLLQGKRQARAINAVFPATRAITNRTRDD